MTTATNDETEGTVGAGHGLTGVAALVALLAGVLVLQRRP